VSSAPAAKHRAQGPTGAGTALLLMGFALACGEPAPAPAPAPAADAADAAPAARTDTFTAAPRGLDAAAIAALAPQPPTRVGRTPAPLPDDPRYAGTVARLRAIVERWGADPQNPWAISHALLALGPRVPLPDGRDAVTAVFELWAERFEVGGHTFVRFPRKRGDIRVEPHAALMLKNMVEVGVSPDQQVQVQGHPHTVADLYRGVLLSSALDPRANRSTFASTNDMPWALAGLAAWAPPPAPGAAPAGATPDLKWTAADGTPMSLLDFSIFNASVLFAESQPLFDTMQAGAALQKRGQGIFKYTCGGAHLLQGVAYAHARGYTTPLVAKGLQGQIALMFWRLTAELKLYDETMKALKEHDHMILLLVQRLKFTGHFLETMHKMAAMGLFAPTNAQKQALKGAADQVVLTVEALESQGVLKDVGALRAKDEQLYLDVIGDSAHAVRGLELAMGKGEVRY